MIDFNKIMYGLDDLCIMPSITTKTTHRSEASVTNEDGKLPIFVSPMSSIINEVNYTKFNDAGLNVIIPRTVPIEKRIALMTTVFVALSINEFKSLFLSDKSVSADDSKKFYVCIDVANGHMEYLHNLIFEAKNKYRKSLVIMAGSVARGELYKEFAKIGVDYIRIGIGGGSICTTSVLSGCHVTLPQILFDMLSYKKHVEDNYKTIHNTLRDTNSSEGFNLDQAITAITGTTRSTQQRKQKERGIVDELYTVPKIIADGGIDSYAKINKLLALGADYVMLGNMLAKTEEACGEVVDINNKKYHTYYGMSTQKAQKEYGIKDEDLRLPEGIEIKVPIEYTLDEFIENFKFYLREAMSLTDCRSLSDFNPNKIELRIISESAFRNFNCNK